MSGRPLLSLDGVHASYGESRVLRGVSLAVEEDEVVSLIGRNGAGKTTTLRSIVGILTPSEGTVTLDGEDITGLSDHETVNRGIGYVPEDRQVFPDLTVVENLRMGAIKTEAGIFTVETVLDEFPQIRDRREQKASQLSGGEQQMLVIARALLSPTKVLLLDEPTEGLAPQIVSDVLDIIREIQQQGVAVLLVEQNVNAATSVADRHYVIDRGRIVFDGTTEELQGAEEVKEQHLGVGVDVGAEMRD